MRKIGLWLAVAGVVCVTKSPAVSLDDIQFWIGTGTNRAALVVEWSTPESFGPSTVPAPIATQSLVWGYRFNGTNTGTQMLKAVLDADPRLYAAASVTWGTYFEAFGFNLDGRGTAGIADSSHTNFLTTNFLTTITVDIDAAASLNPADLYWAGMSGPNWEVWTEAGDAGGFDHSPDRGSNLYWTPDDASQPWSGKHGQWELAQLGLDRLPLTNGSWIGFTVAAGELDYLNTPITDPFYVHKHAPAEPNPTITALVKNFTGSFQGGQWQARFGSCSNWVYTLERSSDLKNWATVVTGLAGSNTNLMASDPNPPSGQSFYRVRAERP